MRLHHVLIPALIVATASHADQRGTYRQCAEALADKFQCGSCNALWQEFLRQCVPRVMPNITSGALETCIARVSAEDKYKPLGWDRERDVFNCLQN
jgi:hypothetical protein